MNDELKENGLPKEKDDYVFSWRKLCSWISLLLSVMLYVAAIGLAIMCISSATEDDEKEVKIISYIAIGVAAYFLISEYILQLFQ